MIHHVETTSMEADGNCLATSSGKADAGYPLIGMDSGEVGPRASYPQISMAAPAPTQVVNAARAINAVKVFGEGPTAVRALDGISLTLPRGEFTAIMGASGSGKSTLLHCMAGLDTLTSGQVLIGDTDLSTLDDAELTMIRRDRVGFIFQAFNLIPTLTAAENIALPLAIAGRKPDGEWFAAVVAALHLGDRLTHRPSQLSGGQQQRVAAARALITRPDLVFADEPSGNLDSRSGQQLLEFLREAVEEFGQTIVLVTHDANAAAYSDRVVFLADGRVVDELTDPTADLVLDRVKNLDS
jgi:putative ABC transport system ATP-binding protein